MTVKKFTSVLNAARRLGATLLLAIIVILQPYISLTAFAVSAGNGYDPTFYSMNDILYYDPRSALCVSDGSASDGSVYTSDVDKAFSLGTDNSMRPVNLAHQLMKDFSLNEAQAAGIVGNFMHESGGAHVPPDINEGGKAGPPAFSGGYGWAQWTGARQVSFIDFAISKGFMGSKSEHATDAANYGWLKYELIKTERSTIPAVAKTSTPKDAATAFEAQFERAGVPALERRIAYANQLYTALKNGTGVDINTPSTGGTEASISNCVTNGSGTVTTGQVFDNVVFPLTVKQSDIHNKGIFHDGTTERAGHPYIAFDILADAGTQVVALTNGTVTDVAADGSLGGNITIYNSEKKLHVFYTHMIPDKSIRVGDTISPGMPLGVLLSVKVKPAINANHLHIDAGQGKFRLGCSRSNSNGAGCNTRVDIGPDLFNGWETLAK